MSEEQKTPDDFVLTDWCKNETKPIMEFYREIVDKARLSLTKGGGDAGLLSNGIKAAEKIIAYGHGAPSQKHEVSGAGGGPIQTKSTIDFGQISDDTIRELLAAKRKV